MSSIALYSVHMNLGHLQMTYVIASYLRVRYVHRGIPADGHSMVDHTVLEIEERDIHVDLRSERNVRHVPPHLHAFDKLYCRSTCTFL